MGEVTNGIDVYFVTTNGKKYAVRQATTYAKGNLSKYEFKKMIFSGCRETFGTS